MYADIHYLQYKGFLDFPKENAFSFVLITLAMYSCYDNV